ncbi:hypothetical protein [Vibrio phage vB_VibM_10AMN]|uniref:Uncharacterized protein n=1 Tax=Staphylococcus phage vB_VibM_10AMN12 TaxID=3076785 RepID=A0AA96KSI6_9CAUD|nr:hypothetical protein [Vibrio phage vB_VibM_10AMN]WNO47482.1 hypothetical protein [Staphylococcus phage vB_VibM_10AMN12]
MKQLLTYYAPNRCSSEDTQDLYLGFEEIKPLVSLINKIQTEIKDNILLYGKEVNNHLDPEIQTLCDRLLCLLEEDVVIDLKQKKLIKEG